MVLFSWVNSLFICLIFLNDNNCLLAHASLISATLWPFGSWKKEKETEPFFGLECSLSNHRTVHLSANCYRSQAYREKQTRCRKPLYFQSLSSVQSNLIQLHLIDLSTPSGLHSCSETSSACLDTWCYITLSTHKDHWLCAFATEKQHVVGMYYWKDI